VHDIKVLKPGPFCSVQNVPAFDKGQIPAPDTMFQSQVYYLFRRRINLKEETNGKFILN
jgi:hypothetical protein